MQAAESRPCHVENGTSPLFENDLTIPQDAYEDAVPAFYTSAVTRYPLNV